MENLIRYDNRKIYSLNAKQYVTLKRISEQVKAGMKVKVIDYNTKNDITPQILARAAYDYTLNNFSQEALENLIGGKNG